MSSLEHNQGPEYETGIVEQLACKRCSTVLMRAEFASGDGYCERCEMDLLIVAEYPIYS